MAEEKIRFQMRIDPDTDRKIKAAMPLANSRSQNEFVETDTLLLRLPDGRRLHVSACVHVPVRSARYGSGCDPR